jgi:hypothetical protein
MGGDNQGAWSSGRQRHSQILISIDVNEVTEGNWGSLKF